ncbi:hypothetical protein [Marvinbryantia formatexigens]|nr:hypothetical protein [Marvinbryantia formatexigens]UWO26821.1 hypothetical protein NQ534_10395 [Marvinbryantia formatexigens DSM 14469]
MRDADPYEQKRNANAESGTICEYGEDCGNPKDGAIQGFHQNPVSI